MRQVVVYDFDKTLTYKDTLLGFFRFAAKKDLCYQCKWLIYFFGMISAKLGFISNDMLKNIGIKMFLKTLDKNDIEEKFANYYKTIRFNKVFKELAYNDDIDHYIVSASFKEYLQPIFPDFVTILGSEVKYIDTKAYELGYNCYKENKVSCLKKLQVNKIDILYTDSYSDYALAKMSDKIIVVNGDVETVCNSINEFKRYFNK